MLAKIGLVITGIVLAVFAMGRVESVAKHRGFSESAVWAQESDDQADDAVSQDDDASQADAASQDDQAVQMLGIKVFASSVEIIREKSSRTV
jgi:hypothetical protein